MSDRRKILPRDELAAVLAEARAGGARVVLCNGVFDLLHVGHVRVLRAARGEGDLLVVALNDDASTRRLKGVGRPLQPAAERAEILSALACVDYVTWFAEDTVAATLRALRPAVHAKGGDYDPERIPDDERRTAAELGIRLALVGGAKVRSSSRLAELLAAAGRSRP